jgi:hypothetical protein
MGVGPENKLFNMGTSLFIDFAWFGSNLGSNAIELR